MTYRGDGEPEYIDDDEFGDGGGVGGRRSNVLGGSGAWRDDDFAPDNPQAETPKDSGSRKGAAKRNAVKARNPAPSVASSEERRARLAGKHPAARERAKPDRERKGETQRQNDSAKDRNRLAGLRARFSRRDETSAPAGGRDRSPSSSIAAGFRSRVARWRKRLPGGADDGGENPAPAERRGNGASARLRPDGGRADSGAGFAARDRLDAAGGRASMRPRIESDAWLDLDRKLDLIGVALVFGAIVLFFSALSAEQAAISGFNAVIGQLLGWGALALPVAMFAIGFWLIIRHFGDRAPTVDPVRLTGVALSFLSVLILFQFIESVSYGGALLQLEICRNPANPLCVEALVQASYQAGRGGGLIGGWLYSALVNNLTEIGGFVFALMVVTVGAMLLTRSSMAEMALVAIGLGRGLRTSISQYAAKRRAARPLMPPMALGGNRSHVRVTKPQAARLTGVRAAQALPAPSEESKPIPLRIREFLGRGARVDAHQEQESLPLVAAGENAMRTPNVLARLFGRGAAVDRDASAETARAEPQSNPLERFLNLGDDLPFKTEEAPVWRKPARPSSAPPPTTPAPLRPLPPEPPPKQETNGASNASGPAPADRPPTATMPPTPVDDAETPAEPKAEAAAPAEPKDAAPAADAPPSKIASETNPTDPPDEAPPATSHPPAPRPRVDWQLPDYRELLNSGTEGELDREPLLRQAQIIEDTLASFGAPGRVVEVNSGPVITQYGVEPAYLTARGGKQNRVKVGAIAKLDKDLQLALGAKSIRVEAPVPGKGYVGIEVPNPDSARVSLRDVMESRSYQTIDSPLAIALGVSVDGTPISGDLTQMPHLLIAGTTGSGKSVCVNAIINSLISVNSPDVVKFIMVDPKRVELTGYNGVPHLVAPVVVELERTIGVLRWVTTEMDARYKKFSLAGARNIVDYNSILDPDLAPMPYIVVIIDELADLMMMAPDDTERAITRIAALARATGIHLVIATQRPSVDVVTGLIKANCPARIAFAVAGSVDSRVILDQPGAERLLGKGDMLYLSGNSPAPLRMQGVHVSNEEINRIIRYWQRQGAGVPGGVPFRLPDPAAQAERHEATNGGDPSDLSAGSEQAAFWEMAPPLGKGAARPGSANPEEDELYQTAVDMVRRLEKASISLLQRRLRIGYTRAARLMDMMEERGVVGPPKEGSSKPRDVLPE